MRANWHLLTLASGQALGTLTRLRSTQIVVDRGLNVFVVVLRSTAALLTLQELWLPVIIGPLVTVIKHHRVIVTD